MPNVIATASKTTTDVLDSVSTATGFITKGLTSLDNYSNKMLRHSEYVSEMAQYDFKVDHKEMEKRGQQRAIRRAAEQDEDFLKDLEDSKFRKLCERNAKQFYGEQAVEDLIPDDI